MHKELERLEKNQERRLKREKQKKILQKRDSHIGSAAGDNGGGEGSPEPTIEKGTGTTRKCANCGQVGHIKTNKKSVQPLLSVDDHGRWQCHKCRECQLLRLHLALLGEVGIFPQKTNKKRAQR